MKPRDEAFTRSPTTGRKYDVLGGKADVKDRTDVLIIGGGVAGLAAGCYARMCGFDTRWALSVLRVWESLVLVRASGARNRWFKSSHPD